MSGHCHGLIIIVLTTSFDFKDHHAIQKPIFMTPYETLRNTCLYTQYIYIDIFVHDIY